MTINHHLSEDPVRRLMIGALAVALALTLLAQWRLFAAPNGLVVDAAASLVAPGQPRVLLVRAEASEVGQVRQELRTRGVSDILDITQDRTGSITILPAEFGISRRVLLASGEERLTLLPADVRVPALTMSQLRTFPRGTATLKGMVAVVGKPTTFDPARFLAGGLGNPPQLGAAELLARAAHAVKSGRVAREVTGVARLLLLLAAASGLVHVLQFSGRRSQLTATLLVATALGGGAFLLLRFAGLLLPVTELVLLTGFTGVLVSARRRGERERRFETLADRSGAYVQRDSLLLEPQRWVEFFPAAARLAGARRSLLLRDEIEGGLQVVGTSGASETKSALLRTESLDDADERAPSPVPVSLPGWEECHIARLGWSGGGAIYWLFEIDDLLAQEEVLAAAGRLARRTSEQPALAAPDRQTVSRRPIDARLFTSLSALIARAGEFRSVVGALQSATMLYDGSGIPVQVNASMKRLLEHASLDPTRATAVDVAAGLSGMEPARARELLGEIVRHGGDVRLASQAEIGGRRFALRVTDAKGDLLFEAVDVTEEFRLARLQSELAGDIDARLRNDLEAIELAARLATDKRLPVERRERVLSMIRDAASRSRSTLDDLARLVEATVYDDDKAYPVSPRTSLIQAELALRPEATAAGVRLEVEQPALTAMVAAEPTILDRLILALLQVPLSDSPRGSTVRAVLSELPDMTILDVTGGFGLASDRFEAVLEDRSRDMFPPLRTIQQSLARVEGWGGSLDARSDTGEGYHFTLRLRRA